MGKPHRQLRSSALKKRILKTDIKTNVISEASKKSVNSGQQYNAAFPADKNVFRAINLMLLLKYFGTNVITYLLDDRGLHTKFFRTSGVTGLIQLVECVKHKFLIQKNNLKHDLNVLHFLGMFNDLVKNRFNATNIVLDGCKTFKTLRETIENTLKNNTAQSVLLALTVCNHQGGHKTYNRRNNIAQESIDIETMIKKYYKIIYAAPIHTYGNGLYMSSRHFVLELI